jgi:hypothetical protein
MVVLGSKMEVTLHPDKMPEKDFVHIAAKEQ